MFPVSFFLSFLLHNSLYLPESFSLSVSVSVQMGIWLLFIAGWIVFLIVEVIIESIRQNDATRQVNELNGVRVHYQKLVREATHRAKTAESALERAMDNHAEDMEDMFTEDELEERMEDARIENDLLTAKNEKLEREAADHTQVLERLQFLTGAVIEADRKRARRLRIRGLSGDSKHSFREVVRQARYFWPLHGAMNSADDPLSDTSSDGESTPDDDTKADASEVIPK